jgi:endonuclease/exonuclease/phosphatase family metal-dependent hydrolase
MGEAIFLHQYQTGVFYFGGNMLLNLQRSGNSAIELWASPDTVQAVVEEHLQLLQPATNSDRCLKIASWNAEYLWQHKAAYFLRSYETILEKHHIIALQEISSAALSLISQQTGYSYVVSSSNTRGQAVGFLIHPRLTILSCREHSELTDIYHVRDLRPALEIEVFDSLLGNLTFITVHLKSMLREPLFTRAVRKKQLEKLLATLNQTKQNLMVLGDFNCWLGYTDNISSLTTNGFLLANPHNKQATQMEGARLDGLFYKNLTNLSVNDYCLSNFWQNPSGKSLSDHGLLSWTLS